MLFEYPGKMELIFETENNAQFLDAGIRIFFDKFDDMIHFVIQKSLSWRQIEINLTGTVQ